MHSRQPADNAAVSLSRSQPTPGDALCKVAFVDLDVAKVTPRTSCRSTASSDSDESATSSTPTMTSSPRDSDDLPPNSAATWKTYVYFYPRHDMTYTRCLLTASRHIDCHTPSSTSACWPSLPTEDNVPTGGLRTGRPGDQTASPGGVSRWRRRVNAARTPYWFPVARSYDAAAPVYLCYPRHDLTYAEVEASRIDRQPGVQQSSLPFDTILEELADDESSVDDWSYDLEDRKSVVSNPGDIASVGLQLPCSGVRGGTRSTTSSLSACGSDDERTQTALLPAPHCYDDTAEQSQSVVDHEITSSDRWMNTRDSILTPVTKLDLKILDVVTTRQRVDSGPRVRAVVHSPVVEKGRVRRCRSESAVPRPGGRQSPVREMPLSARVVKRINRFSAADEDCVNDVAADGDQSGCSQPAVIPLRAKRGVTCLLRDQQPFNSLILPPRGPTSVADVIDDVTVSRRGCQFSVATTSLVTASEDQRDTNYINDGTENVDQSLGCAAASVTDNVAWKVRAEMTSPDVTSLIADSLTVDWSQTSSEYLTPPTRCYPETTYHTPSVSTSCTATRLCDAMSQTPPDAELHCTEVQTGTLDDDALVTTSTRQCNAGSPQTCTFVRPAEVQLSLPSQLEDRQLESRRSYPEHSSVATSSLRVTQSCDVVSPLSENTVHRANVAYLSSQERRQRVTASATVTRVCDYQTVDSSVHPIEDQPTPSLYVPDSNKISGSLMIVIALPPTVLTAVPSTDVHMAQSDVLKQHKPVTASATFTRVCDNTSPAVDTVGDNSQGKVPPCLEQGGFDDKKSRRKSRPPVVAVTGRLGENVVRTSDLPSSRRRSPQHGRPSTLTLPESRTSPTRRPPARRPKIQRIGPDSLADIGGLSAYAASLTPRKPVASGRTVTPVEHGVAACHRHRTPSNSYVNIWRKRVATYEAFVNRCQTTKTATRARSHYCA